MKRLMITGGLLLILAGVACALTEVLDQHSPPTDVRGAADGSGDCGDRSESIPIPEFHVSLLPERVDYQTHIHPVLQQHCVVCHGTEVQSAEIDVSSDPADWSHATRQILTTTPTLAHNPLFQILADLDTAKHHQLPASTHDLLVQWLEQGAHVPEQRPQSKGDFSEAERQHWAFQPLERPRVPDVAGVTSACNPIDAFLLQHMQRAGQQPEKIAGASTRLRRLTFAVTGLPPDQSLATSAQPKPAIMEADSPAWTALVDDFLQQPEYGEHLARYWLDLVRYADTNGYEDDGQKPFVWKYRDFVIQALNQDLPYDDFVRWQLAGDLLAQDWKPDDDRTRNAFVASGFLRLGAWDSEPSNILQAHYDQVGDLVSTTGLVFCGLSIGCARCHDHPLEPLDSHDYTRLAAAFHGLARPVSGRMEQSLAAATDQQLQKAQWIQQQVTRLQRQALFATDSRQATALRHQARLLEPQVRFEHVYRFAETTFSQQPARLLLRGNVQQPAEYVSAGIPAILNCESSPAFSEDGRAARLQLAEWLTSAGHPLLARVIVNRVWQWHFHRGLCATPSNLGLSSQPPSHPELLEWLSDWFVHDANWSLKKLNRLILTSQAFQRRSEPDSPMAEQRRSLYASFIPRPLRAEMLHDAMLEIAGLRSRDMYGPAVDDPDVGAPTDSGSVKTGGDQPRQALHRNASRMYRRAIYLEVRRNRPNPWLQAFGFPDSSVSCDQRATYFSAGQTQMLWSSRRTEACAAGVVRRVRQRSDQAASVQNQATSMFQRILNRPPDNSEQMMIHQFVECGASVDKDNHQAILQELAQVLFNLDEFVTLK